MSRRLKIKNQSHEGLVRKKNMDTWLITWQTLTDEVKLPLKMYFISCSFASPRARESMTVLDCGFHAVDSGFQVLNSSLSHWNFFVIFFFIISFHLSLELGFWIQVVSGSPDSLSWYSGPSYPKDG